MRYAFNINPLDICNNAMNSAKIESISFTCVYAWITLTCHKCSELATRSAESNSRNHCANSAVISNLSCGNCSIFKPSISIKSFHTSITYLVPISFNPTCSKLKRYFQCLYSKIGTWQYFSATTMWRRTMHCFVDNVCWPNESHVFFGIEKIHMYLPYTFDVMFAMW